MADQTIMADHTATSLDDVDARVGETVKVKGDAGWGLYKRLDLRSRKSQMRRKHGKNPKWYCIKSHVLR